MGEIFERTTPTSPFEWTGERLTTAGSFRVGIGRLHRYFFARSLCRELDVVDIAPGEGYGTALLAQVARSAIGIELSAEAVAHAQSAYGGSNLRFMQGDARRIALPDDSVDVVVSFDTIEHFHEQETFVAEVRRILRPDGVFIISSPECDIYSPADRPSNQYHVKELTRAEFGKLLAGKFRNVTMYGQRPLLGGAIIADPPPADAGPLITFERCGDRHFESSDGLPRPLYLVAIATDAPTALRSGSLYVDTSDVEGLLAQTGGLAVIQKEAEEWRQELSERNTQAETWRQQLLANGRELAEARDETHRLRGQLAQADREVSELTIETERLHRILSMSVDDHDIVEARHNALRAERDAAFTELEEHRALLDSKNHELATYAAMLDDSRQQLRAMVSSSSWRLTGPLRGLAARHRGIPHRLKGLAAVNPRLFRAARGSWRLATLRVPERGIVPGEQHALSKPVPCDPDDEAGDDDPAVLPLPEVGSAEPPPPKTNPPLWFFLGDTIDWLQTHARITGVGRVTIELFFASLRSMGDNRVIPCALASGDGELASISLRDSVAYLASRAGAHAASDLLGATDAAATPPATEFQPTPGDHVLFTGVVWTPQFEALFRKLSQQGIGLSVFVHDIIPVEWPDVVGEAYSRTFTHWLETTVTLAGAVFVSGQTVADQILRWAVLSRVPVAARIVPVALGSDEAWRPQLFMKPPDLPRVRLESFVLTVGTIDRRKNQILLVRLWQRLAAERGLHRLPQLVLVGRDDLGLADACPEARALFDDSDIVILDGVSDDDLAALYRVCMFTVFPSLGEGFGLPVAESLCAGKLCLASDLPAIREHAGDLAWYFRADDGLAAYDLLRRAIDDHAARESAEARILRDFRPTEWSATYQAMFAAVERVRDQSRPPRPSLEPRYRIEGVRVAPVMNALAAAQAWCTDVDPEVSILIINWNASPLTRECLRQIWCNTTGIRYEVIIVDNGSDPRDLAALDQLGSGVKLLSLGTNRYFGEANNIAAEHAKGRYVCLLNNNCFVQSGWLAALVAALQAEPELGAAGPLFLFPNGSIQEAGGSINEEGYPIRFGRGGSPDKEALSPRIVDYISAAALLLPRNVFLDAGGFDIAYEPAHYEDADLCFKLRALGRAVRFCPGARVIHIEGAPANDGPTAQARCKALGDLNRGKFMSRWGTYLRDRTEANLQSIAAQIFVTAESRKLGDASGPPRTAALFTPYAITPGGGERFLLTIASYLMRDHVVTVVTPHPYSRLHLTSIGRELGLDLSACRMMTEAAFAQAPEPDLLIAMGNHIVPPTRARGKTSIFLCQFPFPAPAAAIREESKAMGQYRAVIVYSEYVRAHVLAALSAYQFPPWPVEVVYPPVPQIGGHAENKKNRVLSVGRFFTGGHNKRHDLAIASFRKLLEQFDGAVELHLAGALMPGPQHTDHVATLNEMAAGLPVTFHINASREALTALYREATFYWHVAGVGADLEREPEMAEHFGITVVEAMSAACVPFAFNSGGAREIIAHGVDGFLYASLDELITMTRDMLRDDAQATRMKIAQAAQERAAAFAPEVFDARLCRLLARLSAI